jgi:putative molybdopterin biosynthesis protein
MASSGIQRLSTFEQIKLLADARRLSILRHLMSGPASLTQLGHALGQHPAWVRHHLVRLEQDGLVEMTETRTVAGATEKFYRARADGFILQEMILPESLTLPTVIFSGSHDLAVEVLARELGGHLNVVVLPVGSLDGLVMLRQGLCHLSGCHLLDSSGEYNLPFIQHFFPDRAMLVFTLAYREQGLMLFPGNPKQVHNLSDLTRPGIMFANRQKGSGTRLWLDNEIHRLGLPIEKIQGYGREVRLHTECARLVQSGEADMAIGLRAAASQAGLDFIPLFHERYDIVIPQVQADSLMPALDLLQTSAFRQSVARLNGYDTTHTGEQIPL